MLQDITKVALGATYGSFKRVEGHSGNIEAGLACVQKSDGTLSKALADGTLAGISLGSDLSNTGKFMSVCREGSGVPIQLEDGLTPVIGAQVQVHATSGVAVASGTAVNAFYVSSTKTGIKEDGTTCNAALIDFPGGL